jgi:hypothetical protein
MEPYWGRGAIVVCRVLLSLDLLGVGV